MNWWNLSGINNGLEKVKAIHYKSNCNVVSFIRTIPSVPESHRFGHKVRGLTQNAFCDHRRCGLSPRPETDLVFAWPRCGVYLQQMDSIALA